MKIQCPKCQSAIPADQVNMSTDLAFCPACVEGFKISETVDLDPGTSDLLRDPPKGAWVRQEVDHVLLGATTRSPAAFFLVPFMCVWSGFSLVGIYGTQIAKGEFDLGQSLFGVPFLLGSLLFWSLALMAICGKVEVAIGRQSWVFTGIGKLGWKRRFDWSDVRTIREVGTNVRVNGNPQNAIILEGAKRVKFGAGLNENRRYFLLQSLKYLKSKS